MRRIHIAAMLVLAALAVPVSKASAQRIFSPSSGVSPTATEGSVLGGQVEMCQAAPGGSRVRENCEPIEDHRRSQAPPPTPLAVPPPLPQCEAATATEYSQQNDVAHVAGTISTRNCPAGTSGVFALVARVKDANGEIKPIEFQETWQQDDAREVAFSGDYPIGADVELVNVRLRDLVCTCATAPPPAPAEP